MTASTHALGAAAHSRRRWAAVAAAATAATVVVRRIGTMLPTHCRRVGHVDAVRQQAPHRDAARRARSAHGGDRSSPRRLANVCHLPTTPCSLAFLFILSTCPSLLCADVGASDQKNRAESTADAERARMLGYVGLAYGVGFLVGPGLGGMVSSSHLQNSAWLATLGSLVSMAMVLRYLPASRTFAPRPPPKADDGGIEDGSGRSTAARPISRFDLREMHRVCTIKGVPSLLAVKLLSGLGSGLFHAIFALVAEERFQLTPGETGLVMSFIGGLTMLSQVSPGYKKVTCT